MSARDELIDHLTDYLGSSVSGMDRDTAQASARAFAALLLNIRRDATEVDTTRLRDAERTVQWHHALAGDLAIVVEYGTYTTPHHAAWRATP